MVKLPSASRLSLAMKCAGSFILPQVKSDPGEAAKRGTAIHALVENYIRSERTAPEGSGEEERALLRRVGELLGPPAEVFERPELAVAVYPADHSSELYGIARGNAGAAGRERKLSSVVHDEGDHARMDIQVVEREQDLRLLGSGGGLDLTSEDDFPFEYELIFSSNGQDHNAPSEGARDTAGPDRHKSFLAIADLIRCHSESEYEVWDWKSGSSYVPEPQWNWQLILPAVGLWIGSGCRTDFHCSSSILFTDKPDQCPRPYVYDHEFCTRASYYLKRLYDTAATQDAKTVALYEGKHCVFCPARDRCPAKIGAIEAALNAYFWQDDPLDETIMKAVVAIQETSAMRKKAGESILEKHGGVFNLGDGREVVLDKSGKRTKIYTRKAKSGKEERSNAQEDGQSGAEGDGAGSDPEGGA